MKREAFKQFVEQTIEDVVRHAEEKTGKSLSRKIAFGWFHAIESELVRDDIAEYITKRVYIDENNIYPCVDIGVADILDDGTTLIWANVSGHSPRPFQKNWTDREGPFVYIIGQKLIDKLSAS